MREKITFTRKITNIKKQISLTARTHSGFLLPLLVSITFIVTATLAFIKLTRPEGKGGLEEIGLNELTKENFELPAETATLLTDMQASDIPDTNLPAETGNLSANLTQKPSNAFTPFEEEKLFIEEENLQSDNELSYFTYRVKSGDMIGVIAQKYNVSQDTIISVNQIKQSRLIQIGQYLKIPSMSGILYTVKSKSETPATISAKYRIDAEKCAAVNNIQKNTPLTAGATIFLPDAKLDWVTRQEINGDLFIKPIHSYYYLSSYFGWRKNPFDETKRTYHNGMDMACSTGTSVYAALAGKVTTTGYNDTYGNYIIVTHHSGYKTLYGHLSAVLCKKGQYVTTDTKIGKVGSTGKSTGPHLHFTVYKNGKAVNPVNLWK